MACPPLLVGVYMSCSKQSISSKINRDMKAGKPQKQAVAIALSTAKEAEGKSGKAKGRKK